MLPCNVSVTLVFYCAAVYVKHLHHDGNRLILIHAAELPALPTSRESFYTFEEDGKWQTPVLVMPVFKLLLYNESFLNITVNSVLLASDW